MCMFIVSNTGLPHVPLQGSPMHHFLLRLPACRFLNIEPIDLHTRSFQPGKSKYFYARRIFRRSFRTNQDSIYFLRSLGYAFSFDSSYTLRYVDFSLTAFVAAVKVAKKF